MIIPIIPQTKKGFFDILNVEVLLSLLTIEKQTDSYIIVPIKNKRNVVTIPQTPSESGRRLVLPRNLKYVCLKGDWAIDFSISNTVIDSDVEVGIEFPLLLLF